MTSDWLILALLALYWALLILTLASRKDRE